MEIDPPNVVCCARSTPADFTELTWRAWALVKMEAWTGLPTFVNVSEGANGRVQLDQPAGGGHRGRHLRVRRPHGDLERLHSERVRMIGILRIVTTCFIWYMAAGLSAAAAIAQDTSFSDAEGIQTVHEALLEAHLDGDAEGVLANEAEGILVVSRGEVLFPSRQERAEQFSRYLERTVFTEYRDLIEPVVRVSEFGDMGWLIAQVHISGEYITDDGGREPFESTWAWVELYEKREGRWWRVGEVSSRKPVGVDEAE
ncbi:MAG: nuclear transport factor 2 family protein [bacterium]